MKRLPALARLLESFFRRRLVEQRNVSVLTISSYRDALRLLVLFASERNGRQPCELEVADLDRELVLDFLDHLERNRRNGTRTRNARLTAIRSFFRHVAASDPASIGIAQQVLEIPSKRTTMKAPRHLTVAEMNALLQAPDRATVLGRRDYAFLLFLARTGARVSEAIGVDAADLRLDSPTQTLLRGKGRKQRLIPLAADLARALRDLCRERGVGYDERRPIFVGARGERLTRFGATHLVRRAVKRAAVSVPLLGKARVSPHLLRHSLAMQLLQSGSDLVTIQAWLGHANRAGVVPRPGQRFRPKDSVLQMLEKL